VRRHDVLVRVLVQLPSVCCLFSLFCHFSYIYVPFYEANLLVNTIYNYLHSNIVKRYGIPDQGGLVGYISAL
jgi:hypothetical protein